MMETNKIYSIIALLGVVCLASLSVQAVENKPVVVNNDATNPVPISGTVTVQSSASNPVHVSSGEYGFIGTTTETTLPTIGHSGMSDICRGEFNDEARMCTTKEFFQTASRDDIDVGVYFVEPILLTTYYDPDLAQPVHTEYYGRQFIGRWDNKATCRQYVGTASDYSTAVIFRADDGSSHASVAKAGCDQSLPIVCCSPAQ